MIPLTLSIKLDKFLRKFMGTIPNEKELHLLIDLFRMEEHPHTIYGGKRVIFDYLIIEDENERDTFFDNFHIYKSVYVPLGRRRKMTPLELQTKIEYAGFNRVTKKVISRFYNPVKVRIRLDKFTNKQLRRYDL